jgi:RNA polymerase sigma-70 factor (ECF subfamily)
VRAARRDDPEPGPARPKARTRPTMLGSAKYPSWDAIYADNVPRLHRLMFARVGNRPDAEDLTSQVFLTVYGRLHTGATVGEVRAYLLATARTVLVEHWRRTLGHQVTEIDPSEVDLENFAAPGQCDEAGDAPERIARILDALPERSRAILELRFLRGYTIRQAAAELGVSVANAKVLQHRALRHAAGLGKENDLEGDAS